MGHWTPCRGSSYEHDLRLNTTRAFLLYLLPIPTAMLEVSNTLSRANELTCRLKATVRTRSNYRKSTAKLRGLLPLDHSAAKRPSPISEWRILFPPKNFAFRTVHDQRG
jgi:hypothetical protein